MLIYILCHCRFLWAKLVATASLGRAIQNHPWPAQWISLASLGEKVQNPIYQQMLSSHSSDLLSELTMASLGRPGEGQVPLAHALAKVELDPLHRGWWNLEGPRQLPLHLIQVAVDAHSPSPWLHSWLTSLPSCMCCLCLLPAVPCRACAGSAASRV